METKKQCKTCEIINADCNACKSFMETKEQKILDKLYNDRVRQEKIDLGKKLIKKIEQQLKELEKGNEHR